MPLLTIVYKIRFQVLMLFTATILFYNCSHKVKWNDGYYAKGPKCSKDERHEIFCVDNSTIFVERSFTPKNVPVTLNEKFLLQLRGEKLKTLFEQIYIDPKLSELFKDSLLILSTLPKNDFKGKTITQCTYCDYVTTFKFRNKVFAYPWFLGVEQYDLNVRYDTTSTWIIKSYEIEGQHGRVYFNKSKKNDVPIHLFTNDEKKLPSVFFDKIILAKPDDKSRPK